MDKKHDADRKHGIRITVFHGSVIFFRRRLNAFQSPSMQPFLFFGRDKTAVLLYRRGSGAVFYIDNYEGWVRINTATNLDLLKEAMMRFIEFYKSYK